MDVIIWFQLTGQLCNAKAVFTDSAMKRSFGDFLGLHYRKMQKLQVSIIGVSMYCCILKNKKMNHQQLEKILGPPIMNQAFKPILAQRPQILIVLNRSFLDNM